ELDSLRLERESFAGRLHPGLLRCPDAEKGAMPLLRGKGAHPRDLGIAEATSCQSIEIDAPVVAFDVHADVGHVSDGEHGAPLGMGEVEAEVRPGEPWLAFLSGGEDE